MTDERTPARSPPEGGGFEWLRRAAHKFDQGLEWVSRLAAVLGAAVLVLISLIVTVSVVARDVFAVGLLDAVTPGRMAVTLAVFLGIAWALRQGKHVTVDLVIDRLPYRWRHGIGAFTMSVALVAICLLIWQTWEFAFAAWRMDEKIIGDILWPAFPFQAVIPGGLALLALEMLRKIIHSIGYAIEGLPAPD